MFEDAIKFLSESNIPAVWILFFAFFITFFENIFPPSPSDMILVFLGGLAGIREINFIALLVFSTTGSVVGFALMYWLGYAFGTKIIESGKISFISEESLEKPRLWFKRWGFTIIVLNRFLSGTRAVISFFAGITKINTSITFILAAVSSLLWNSILIWIGLELGENWRRADEYLEIYGNIILTLVWLTVLFFVVRWFWKRKKENRKN